VQEKTSNIRTPHETKTFQFRVEKMVKLSLDTDISVITNYHS
jgi:hypothetical protein